MRLIHAFFLTSMACGCWLPRCLGERGSSGLAWMTRHRLPGSLWPWGAGA